ncbi:MAG: glycosyltransferase family 4 protein [Bdellovibrionales bacterium]
MKILFANLSSLKFDVAMPGGEPLGGSESCVCYLARQLAGNGHDVTLVARLPENTPAQVLGVRHHPVEVIRKQTFFETEKFNVIVTSNAVVACPRFREYSPASVNVFWDHLPPDQQAISPLGNPLVRQAIDCIVYVSAWQKIETERRFGLDMSNRVLANGVTPSFEGMFASPADLLAAKQNRATYTSVPDRGLSELLDVWAGLEGDTSLDVYSSMRVYQADDEACAGLILRAREIPLVKWHGSVGQNDLAVRLRPAAFLAYPCVTTETFCLAALEAMAAGMKVIATDTGGIAATTMGFADLLPTRSGDSREQFMRNYRELLNRNINDFRRNPVAWSERAFAQAEAVNRQCRWEQRAREWEDLLYELAERKRAVATRQSSG